MSDSMQVTDCHAEPSRVQAAVDPTTCHDLSLQRLSTSGNCRSVTVPEREGFCRHAGSPKAYIKVADKRGNKRATFQVFCAIAGSHMYSHAAVEAPDRFVCVWVVCKSEPRSCRASESGADRVAWYRNLQGMEQRPGR